MKWKIIKVFYEVDSSTSRVSRLFKSLSKTTTTNISSENEV